MISRLSKVLAAAALTGLIAACNTVTLDDPEPAAPPAEVTASAGAGNAAGGAGAGAGGLTEVPMDPFNPQSVLAQERSVYFEFDSYAVPERYRARVETHARYLVGQPGQRVLIEGHTDERGGTEYNLALGQRRADAVRRMLTLFGTADAQIETISFGREKPRATGSSEADWAENRRADIVYQR